MSRMKFDKEEKEILNKLPVSVWSEIGDDTGLIIENGTIVGFESFRV